MALAYSAPGLWNCREFLRAYAYDGKRYVKAHSETLLTTLRACAVFIVNITTADQRHLSAKEKADCLSSAIGLFKIVCPDENYGYYHGYIASLKMLFSLYLWFDGRKDEAFEALAPRTPVPIFCPRRRTGPGGLSRRWSRSRRKSGKTPAGTPGFLISAAPDRRCHLHTIRCSAARWKYKWSVSVRYAPPPFFITPTIRRGQNPSSNPQPANSCSSTHRTQQNKVFAPSQFCRGSFL